MQFINLKEQPSLSVELPNGTYILTRRLIPASQIKNHDEKLKQISQDYQDNKIDYVEFAHLFFEVSLSDYKREIVDQLSVHDLTSLINAVKGLLVYNREITLDEKKSV